MKCALVGNTTVGIRALHRVA